MQGPVGGEGGGVTRPVAAHDQQRIGPQRARTSAPGLTVSPNVLLDRGHPTRGGGRALEGVRGQQQAVRADVAQDDRAVVRQLRLRTSTGELLIPGGQAMAAQSSPRRKPHYTRRTKNYQTLLPYWPLS
jgi:hypothetical protein